MTSEPKTPAPAGHAAAAPAGPPRKRRRLVGVLLHVVVPLGVVAGGVLLAMHLITTAPEAKRQRPTPRALLVDVEAVSFSRHQAVVPAMGTVCPSRSVDLHPRVSGEIVQVSAEFLPGGRFRAGDPILQIDRQDYALAVERSGLDLKQSQLAIEQSDLAIEQRRSTIARTEGERQLEQGQQAVAQREYELLGETVSEDEKELVLRQPQLRTVEAAEQGAKAALAEAEVAKKTAQVAVDQARNDLRQAQLDLERTAIRAPFNALVTSRGVNLGATVSTTTALATLVGTDAYWVEVAVPVDQLKWVRIPRAATEQGSAVRVYDEAAWGADRFRTGHVCRLMGDLEEQGRMARLLVSVEDPLALAEANRDQPALLLGSYVRVEIEGTDIESAATVNRSLVRDGRNIWVMGRDGRLEIRPVTIAFRGRDHVLVTGGIQAGDRLVTTDLSAPVAGMPLRLRTDEPPAPESAASNPAPAPAAEGTLR